jgi:hypothetical protein
MLIPVGWCATARGVLITLLLQTLSCGLRTAWHMHLGTVVTMHTHSSLLPDQCAWVCGDSVIPAVILAAAAAIVARTGRSVFMTTLQPFHLHAHMIC